ncbi:hypothetical protein CPLU01_01343 [Colletotrichum plurivorum]|uniref:Uncharacterized protein n=1 Tax=Colletotrichum plurivorum TaxID=2175906 RepID=A0A8H6NPT3_9PEZI|nr:hypothetical protein CPLU01_01343 [Colletotrichum plurivorum]
MELFQNSAGSLDASTRLWIHGETDQLPTSLHYACFLGILPVIQALCSRRSVVRDMLNAQCDDHGTPLEIAAGMGQEDVVRLLLNKGANPNAKNAARKTSPLIRASANGHLGTVQCLLDAGARVNNATTMHSQTALTAAAAAGHVDIMRLLLLRGARADTTTLI